MLKRLFQSRKRRSVDGAKLPYPHVDLFHWSPSDGNVNFGDRLAEIVTRQMLALHGLSLDDQVARDTRLLAVGSVLHFARDGDHVWGTGWNGKVPERQFTARNLCVHAVRGPLTAEFLRKRGIAVPDVYGDPALLVPHLLRDRFAVDPVHEHVFVPNLNDLALTRNFANVISPLWGWNVVISHILKARLVLASSLHGLVVAEAFGIPARYVRLSDTENLFKYEDYYLGSGRSEGDIAFARSVEEGLEMGGMPPACYEAAPLLDAFPYDLWYHG